MLLVALLLLKTAYSSNVTQNIAPHYVLKACKHGNFLLNDFDIDVSEHLRLYGEWSELELELFLSIIQSDDIVLDVGANIGAFTIPLAKKVGQHGRVHAFEPQRIINQRLNANVVLNGLENVITYHAALGNSSGSIAVPYLEYSVDSNFGALSLVRGYGNITTEWSYNVSLVTLDSINYYNPYTGKDCPTFVKMDVELMERSVLQGGITMITRCKPIIHTENNNELTSAGLVEQFYVMDYVPFWDIKPNFNPAFKDTHPDITNGYHNMNMICIPREKLSSEGGTVVMLGAVQVMRDKPYLRDYFLYPGADGTLGPRFRQHTD
jgi:FkbM family methyltransferase